MKNAAEILNAITAKTIFKKDAGTFFQNAGYKPCICDIKSAPFYVSDKWLIQKIEISKTQKGNLKAYAGKTVEIIPTEVTQTARIKFFIKEI